MAMRGSKDDGDALRFLALCRVLVGNVRVDDSTVPPRGGGGDYDSLYSPVDEEYRPLKPDHVLPEFLLLYRLAPNGRRAAPPDDDGAAAAAASAAPGAADPRRSAAAPKRRDETATTASAALERVAQRTEGLFRAPDDASDDARAPSPAHRPGRAPAPRHPSPAKRRDKRHADFDRGPDLKPMALAAALLPPDDAARTKGGPSSPSRSPRAAPPAARLDLADGDDAASGDVATRWEHVLHNALHEKRRIVSHIELLLSGRAKHGALRGSPAKLKPQASFR